MSVVFNKKNKGCKLSYIELLDYIEQNFNYDLITIVDNDVIFKRDFVEKLKDIYYNSIINLKSNYIVLSGFKPTNSHLKQIDSDKKYNNFHIRNSVGGVCYIFNKHSRDLVLCWMEKKFRLGS